jgi:4-amino-4-deoxy-L-arabinose transferase-like glycosyltransferase
MSMPDQSRIRPWDVALLIGAASVLLFPALGQVPFRRAEIYFADVARAMLERGDWLIPHFRGEPFFDKPALMYWLLAACFKVFGFSIGASRVASALATLLVIAATVWLGWLLWEDRLSALFSGWILVATVSFMAFGRLAMSDMLLVLCSTVAIGLGTFCYRSERPPSLAIVALAAVLGVGFFTKGPVALLIPGLGLLCLIWERRARLPRISATTFLLSALVFFLVALGWFGAVYLRLGVEPLRFFFVRENLQRFSGDAHDVGRPVWFYLVTYLGQGAPWSLLMPMAAFEFLRRKLDAGGRMLIFWMLLVGGVLTLSQGKLDYYLLPLYPAAALIVGRYLRVTPWSRGLRAILSFALAVLGAALILLPVPVLRMPGDWRPQGAVLVVTVCLLLVAGGACLAVAFRPTSGASLRVLVAALAVAFGITYISVLPAFYRGQPNAAILAAASREQLLQPSLGIAVHGDPLQLHRDFLFESRVVIEESNDLHSLALAARPYLLLADGEEAEKLKTTTPVREVGSYTYLDAGVFSFRGVLAPPVPRRLVLLANFGL